jgi:curved DNA-binding protein CbpA
VRHASATASSDEELAFPAPPYGPYEIFHLPRSASDADIKARYYDLVRLLHPDRAGVADGSAAKQQKRQWEEMQKAYELLRSSRARQMYDRSGLGWNSHGSAAARARAAAARQGWQFRGAPGHDGFGWQAESARSDFFYGANPAPKAEERYTSNVRFFLAIAVITWSLAGVQYSRLSAQSARAVERADRAHSDAVKSLQEARDLARSREGRTRMENLRRRARELDYFGRVEAERCTAVPPPLLQLEAPRSSPRQ